MGLLPYFLAVILLVQSEGSISGPSVQWEFGQDGSDLHVMNQLSGKITSDKITRVSIPMSSCMEIKYVHVELWNTLSTPEVQFNRNTNTITITYKLLQSVLSNYEIVAKGKKSPQCGDSGGNNNNGYNNNNNEYYNEYYNHNNGYNNPNNNGYNHINGYHNHNNGPNNNNRGRYFSGGSNNGHRGGHNGYGGDNNVYRSDNNGHRGGNNGHRGGNNPNRGRYLSGNNGLGFGGDNNGNFNGNKGGRGPNSPGSGWGRGNG